MEVSNSMRLKFIKDFNLPIKIVKEDLFDYYINLLDKYYGSIAKYNLFKEYVGSKSSEEDFFKESADLKERMILSIHANNFLSKFNSFDYKKYEFRVEDIKNERTYIEQNMGESFVSIDLKTANFQSIKYIDPGFVGGADTYLDFLSKFTNEAYLMKSKSLRQVMFGDSRLNPKRQQMIQRFIIHTLYQHFLDSGIVNKSDAVEITSDEIIFNKKNIKKDIESGLKSLPDSIQGAIFHVNNFLIEKIHPNYDFCLRKSDDGKLELKNVPASFVPEVIKYLNSGKESSYREKLIEADRLFYENKRVAVYKDYLF